MNVRNLLTGIAVGAVVAIVFHEADRAGLDLTQWSMRGPDIGHMMILGALIGAISQTVGQSRSRR